MKNICRQSAAMILLRQTKDDFKVLLVKRNPNISFASSWAFPGGAAEKQDFELANQNSELIDKCHSSFYNKLFTSWYPTSLICALRETQEETGIKLDINHYIMNSQPILRLITPQHIQKRYDTQFYVYNLSSTEVEDSLWDEIKIDNTECIDYLWETPKYFIEKFLEGKMMLFPPIFLQLFALRQLGSINNVFEYIKMVNKEYQYNCTFPFLFQFKQIKDQNLLHIIQYPDELFDRKSVISNETNIILRTELERRIEYSKQAIKFRFIQQEDDKNFKFESQIDLPYYSFLSCLQNLKIQNQRQIDQSPKL